MRPVAVFANLVTCWFVPLMCAAAPHIQVVDETGQPLPRFEFMLHTDGHGYTPWSVGEDGKISWGETFPRSPRIDVLLRADGFAPFAEVFEGTRLDGLRSAQFAMQQGTDVELRFRLPQGMTWPAGLFPEGYFVDYEDRVRAMRQPSNRRLSKPDFNMLNLRARGPARFSLRISPKTPPFHVAVHLPGFLQCFESGPFTLADFVDGVLEIELPRPGCIEASFSPAAKDDAHPFQLAMLELMWNLPGQRNSYLTVQSARDPQARPRLLAEDLAPGNYMIWLGTQSKENVEKETGTGINLGVYHDREQIALKPGSNHRVDFQQQAYQPDAFRGGRSARVRVLAASGEPARGQTLKVGYWDGHYGEQQVFKGMIPDSGVIALENITDRGRSDSPGPYTVEVGGKQLGVFSLTGKEGGAELVFHVAPMPGDSAPDVPLLEIATGQTRQLADLRGKLILLEFWATWCGPCQPAMEKLNQVAEQQAAAWKDLVLLMPVSIDDSSRLAANHIRRRGWNQLAHYWTGTEGFGNGKSAGARAYVVNGVPNAILIGRDGKILWRGHPLHPEDGVELTARIERALKDNP